MGGEDTGVREDTTEVFLEVAYSTPIRIAATGPQARHPVRRALPLRARHRSRIVLRGAPRSATRLILELCGGEASEVVSQRRHARLAAQLHAAPRSREDADGDRRAGRRRPPRSWPSSASASSGSGPWTAAVPSWRPDIVGEADLVEEVTRVFGFDNIPTTSAAAPVGHVQAGAHAAAAPRAAGPPGARRARHERGGDLVVPAAQAGRAVRRRPARTCASLNSIDADARHDAALDPAQPDRRGAAQRGARAWPIRRCSRSARTTRTRRRRASAPSRPACASNMAVPRNWAGPGARRRRLRRQGRCAGRAGRDRRAVDNLSDPAGRARLVPSRPLGR